MIATTFTCDKCGASEQVDHSAKLKIKYWHVRLSCWQVGEPDGTETLRTEQWCNACKVAYPKEQVIL